MGDPAAMTIPHQKKLLKKHTTRVAILKKVIRLCVLLLKSGGRYELV
jgi:hypothetical protein